MWIERAVKIMTNARCEDVMNSDADNGKETTITRNKRSNNIYATINLETQNNIKLIMENG